MYKNLINWVDLDYTVSQLSSGALTQKALSQRIYRAKNDSGKLLTLKLAQFIYNSEVSADED